MVHFDEKILCLCKLSPSTKIISKLSIVCDFRILLVNQSITCNKSAN